MKDNHSTQQETRRVPSALISGLLLMAGIVSCTSVPDTTPELRTEQPHRPLEKFLVLDSRNIAQTVNARLAVGTVSKHPANPLFGEDRPWEQRFDNLYANVVYDEQDGLYKCWYNPFIISNPEATVPREKRVEVDFAKTGLFPREFALCYATSVDGIAWTKPDLGLFEYEGSRENNIVLRSIVGVEEDGVHGTGVFVDAHETNADRRYKSVFRYVLPGGKKHIATAFSPDGLHWTEPALCSGVGVAGDTHNNALWVEELDRYVLFTRTWDGRVRQVARSESKDFHNWTPAEVALAGLETHLQVYSMGVFRYGGVYLGLVAIYNTNPKVGGLRVGRADRKNDPDIDRVHCELAWSPDTVTWHRVQPGVPFIPNSARPGDYDWGCVYPAVHPVVLEDEIRIYYGGSNNRHTDWRDGFFCLATLRPDGFAGYEPAHEDEPAVIITTPLDLAAGVVALSADVTPGGSISVAVLDDQGHSLLQSKPITRSITAGIVEFDPPLTSRATIISSEVQLCFTIDKAKLYSFSLVRISGAGK